MQSNKQARLLLLVCALLWLTLAAVLRSHAVQVDSSAVPTPPLTQRTGEFVDKRVLVQWLVNDTWLEVYVEAETTGWVGIGFSGDDRMPGSDMVVGFVNSTTALLTDRHTLTQRVQPFLDSTQDVQLLAGSEEGGYTRLRFRRPLAASDAAEIEDRAVASTRYLLFAMGTDDFAPDGSFLQHIHRGRVEVDLLSGVVGSVEPVQHGTRALVHGTLMTVAWLLITPVAVYVAAFLKNPLGRWWLPVHAGLQVVAMCLSLAAFGVIISLVQQYSLGHFK
jgi:DOMON domain